MSLFQDNKCDLTNYISYKKNVNILDSFYEKDRQYILYKYYLCYTIDTEKLKYNTKGENMPRWGIHLEIANRIKDKINIGSNEYLFGNILPDVQDGYLVKDISNILNHLDNHYNDLINNTYEAFYEIHKEIINEDIVIGYLVHLLTDFYFNKSFDKKYKWLDNSNIELKLLTDEKVIMNRDLAGIKYKQHDFKVFEKELIKQKEIETPVFEKDLTYKSNLITVININENDVKKVIKYFDDEFYNVNIDNEYLIYEKEELEKLMKETEEFILEYLTKIGVKNDSII